MSSSDRGGSGERLGARYRSRIRGFLSRSPWAFLVAMALAGPGCGRIGYDLVGGGPGGHGGEPHSGAGGGADGGGAGGGGVVDGSNPGTGGSAGAPTSGGGATDAAGPVSGGGAGAPAGSGGNLTDASTPGSGGTVADAAPAGGGGTSSGGSASGGGSTSSGGSGGTAGTDGGVGSGGAGTDGAGTGGAGTGGAGGGGTVNTPPIARLLVTPGLGDLTTVFMADAAGTTDREDPPSALTYSWDWENDGVFDATGSTATHSYASAGTYTVVVRATDTGGLSGYRGFDVVVVPSSSVLVVTTAVDESNAGATPASPMGAGFSLREALVYANATAGRQSILIPRGTTIVLSGRLPATADGAGVDVVGDRAVIDGSGQKGPSIELASAGDRLLGVEVHGTSGPGVRLSGAGVQVERTYVHDNAGAVETTGAACHFGPDNEIAFQNEGLSVSSQCLVERNRVHDCGSYGIHVVTNGSGSTLRFNATYRNATGIGVAGLTNSVTVVHNVMVFNTGAVSGSGGGIELGGTSQDVRNNILAFNGTYGMDARSASAPIEDYNDYFSNTKGACAGCTPGPHGAAVDPRFIDAATDDYRLLPGSPVIDAAVDLGLDVNGPEPGLFDGPAPDMGAWEAPSPY